MYVRPLTFRSSSLALSVIAQFCVSAFAAIVIRCAKPAPRVTLIRSFSDCFLAMKRTYAAATSTAYLNMPMYIDRYVHLPVGFDNCTLKESRYTGVSLAPKCVGR